MSETLATSVVGFVKGYLALGAVFSLAFAWRGLDRVDPHARGASWGFRLLVTPGVVALWPLLAWRWVSGAREPPQERNAHRAAARATEAAGAER